MSDGPHRSLKMRRGWKRVAERGDKRAFATDEISNAIIPALEQDCREEMSPQFLDSLCTVCRNQEDSLFKDQIEPQLEALRRSAGSGIGRVVLDDVIRLSASGEQGQDIAVKAMTNAFTDRAARGARQVEEHYLREATAPRAQRVRERIDQAISTSADAIRGLARQMLRIDADRSARPPLKRQGLDDGVRL
jgi:hypothetical protein